MLEMTTTGDRSLTITDDVRCTMFPLLSVTVIVMVKFWLLKLTVEKKTCEAEVAEPAKTLAVDPSPQLTLTETIDPSASFEEKAAVTVTPVLAGLGDTVEIVTVGDRSFTVSVPVPDPDPPLLVAVTVIVNV